MANHGGARSGAGRKSGVPNSITQTLRDKIQAEKLLDELQAIVFKNKGKPTTNEKIGAIKFLLGKLLPDVQSVGVEFEAQGIPLRPEISDEQKREIFKAALADLDDPDEDVDE